VLQIYAYNTASICLQTFIQSVFSILGLGIAAVAGALSHTNYKLLTEASFVCDAAPATAAVLRQGIKVTININVISTI
jgi:hypothetical protein